MTASAPATTPVNVSVTRRLPASAERVFDAWLTPESARQWLFATPGGQMVRAEIEPRIGGEFCLVDRRGGVDVAHVGLWLDLTRPTQLVFSFGVPAVSGTFTPVTVDIAPLPDGCEITLLHEGVPAELADRTQAGWAATLERLETTFFAVK